MSIGNDGGLAFLGHGEDLGLLPNLPVGLFYHVSYDMAVAVQRVRRHAGQLRLVRARAPCAAPSGIANHHWATLQGGDGFVVLQDPTDYRVAYSESQDGNMVRVDRVTFETMPIRPQAAEGEPALRWHWDTPLAMSPHDPKVIYAPANKVFRSADRGLSWVAISGDLTGGANRDDLVIDGREGQRHEHRAQRRHRRLAHDRVVRRVAQGARRCSMPAPTTAGWP